MDTYRSDHCRHTTFTTQIRKVEILGDNPLSSDIKKTFSLLNEQRTNLQRKGNLTLMEVATIQSKHLQSHPSLCPNINNLVVSEEINACTFSTLVEMEDETIEQWEIQFKNETHNHPTEIEPFG